MGFNFHTLMSRVTAPLPLRTCHFYAPVITHPPGPTIHTSKNCESEKRVSSVACRFLRKRPFRGHRGNIERMKVDLLDPFTSTTIIFGLITIALYVIVIRPLTPRQAVPNNTARRHQPQESLARTAESISANKKTADRVPAHVSNNVTVTTGGFNILSDGLVAFRYTKAASYENTDEDRKDRARVLTRLLEGSQLETPPARGSTIVLSFQASEVSCPKLQRLLFLLGTFYNLLILIAVDSSFQIPDRPALLAQLRGENIIPVDILPDHRIVTTSTTAGRIAFCRQLSRIELILDFDEEVAANLRRFGHRVRAYGRELLVKHGSSKLGTMLLES